MAFTSVEFLLLVPASLLIYYLLPRRFQWMALLAASLAFYLAAGAISLLWLLAVSCVTYVSAISLDRLNARRRALSDDEREAALPGIKRRKKLVAAADIIACFGLLYVMKYWNETADFLSRHTLAQPGRIDIIIPLGLSFFIFQSVGYVIDVYRDKFGAEKNPARLLLFQCFFPQMVQGPIGRYGDLAPQLYAPRAFDAEALRRGIQLAMWGYFKKLVIADRAAVFVNAVFDDYTAYGGAMIALAVLLYCVQLYCDFSGGIDVTRGVAGMFGVDMAENFRRPIFARSLTDYWRRWHITLGAWMRDYLFYPLSLSRPFGRLGKWSRKHITGTLGRILPTSLATFIVYLVIGIWHGANLKYIAFGLWNGAIITASLLLEGSYRKWKLALHIDEDSRLWRGFQILRTAFIVFIGRYLTRSPGVTAAAWLLVRTIKDPWLFQLTDGTILSLGLSAWGFGVIILGLAVVLAVECLQERGGSIRAALNAKPAWVQTVTLALSLLAILLLGAMSGAASGEFIYKQF